MKNFRFFYTLMAALLVFWNCEVDPLESNSQDLSASKHDTEAVHKSKLQNKVFISEALTHNALGNTNVRKLQIYTPPGYDKHGDRIIYSMVNRFPKKHLSI